MYVYSDRGAPDPAVQVAAWRDFPVDLAPPSASSGTGTEPSGDTLRETPVVAQLLVKISHLLEGHESDECYLQLN